MPSSIVEVSDAVRDKLLSLSPATADRLLKAERRKLGRAKSTTRPGHLIKKQIPVRTFADWSDVRPGFFEADLVAHCGNTVRGQFLNTLTMTDIATGWTELLPLLMRSGADVVTALSEVKDMLPFPMLGFDTDNGDEFINHDILSWCLANKVTFTRSREYRKNDQAHVEEKNGSIVRRLIGYDRYEGIESWQILSTLYRISRLYINFFQPCLKLSSKDRDGGHVRKRYERAQTPYERVLRSHSVSEDRKTLLRELFETLDPVLLLKEVERMQTELWSTATKNNTSEARSMAIGAADTSVENCMPAPVSPVPSEPRRQRKASPQPTVDRSCTPQERKAKLRRVWDYVCEELLKDPSLTDTQILTMLSYLYPGEFGAADLNAIGTRLSRWRKTNSITLESLNRKPGRKSALDEVWHEALQALAKNPTLTASAILSLLSQLDPDRINRGHLTTVKSRLKQWRTRQVDQRTSSEVIGDAFDGHQGDTHGAGKQSGKSTRSKLKGSSRKDLPAWDPDRVLNWANKIGPATAHLTRTILEHANFSQSGVHSCLGLLSLEQEYGSHRLENACKTAATVKRWTISTIRSTLKERLDQTTTQQSLPNLILSKKQAPRSTQRSN